MLSKVIYYYQTLSGLQQLLKNGYATTINLAAIHFGKNSENNPYIHLNDNNPYDQVFDTLWEELHQASQQNIQIILMLGGAGRAYQTLFSDFETYYSLLYQLIKSKPLISGIDLDVEEIVKESNIKMLIKRIRKDFGDDFTISMAPLSYSMEHDTPGMGGFIYKDLYCSPEGSQIDYFNVQSYGSYSLQVYEDIINNGYPPKKIVMGMIYSQNLDIIVNQVKIIKEKYPDFLGVFIWEYFKAPPNAPAHPEHWGQLMKSIVNIKI